MGFLFIVVALLSVGGCSCPGYWGRVVAHISPRPVDPLRSAWLKIDEFEGPQQTKGTDPSCSYYVKRLPVTGAVSVHDCYGPLRDYTEAGWGYMVSVSTWTGGVRPDVRAEIETLANEIRRAIQAQVDDGKVTVAAGPLCMPF